MKYLIGVMLIAVGCTADVPDVPVTVLDAICKATSNLVAEVDPQSSATVRIVVSRYTRALLDEVTLTALRARSGDSGVGDVAAEALLLQDFRKRDVIRREVAAPRDGSCRWTRGTEPEPDELFLEVSSQFENPYVPGERGVLARRSFGGRRGASWFWVRLSRSIEEEKVVKLNVDDH
jgi:hypothetical protein